MNFVQIRAGSIIAGSRLGVTFQGALPLLDESLHLRPLRDIEDRALALSAVVAASYGFPRDRIVSWLERETLTSVLSHLEQAFIFNGEGSVQQFQTQVEALCAFAWALGFLPSLDFGTAAPNHLVFLFPDFKAAESSAPFRTRTRLRAQEEVVAACDLAYCLHWTINQADVDQQSLPGKIHPHVVIERRRALEWMLSSDEWDDVSLDT